MLPWLIYINLYVFGYDILKSCQSLQLGLFFYCYFSFFPSSPRQTRGSYVSPFFIASLFLFLFMVICLVRKSREGIIGKAGLRL